MRLYAAGHLVKAFLKSIPGSTGLLDACRSWRFVFRQGLLSRRIAGHLSIPGYLSANEAMVLYTAVSQLPSDQPQIVEIGSHLGKSSFVLAKALQVRGGGCVHCIDPFDASGDESAAEDYRRRRLDLGRPLLEQFKSNLRKRGVEALVKPLVGMSHDLSLTGVLPNIDMVFIDGDHSHEAVRQDFLDWVPRLSKGGILAMHDVFATPFDGHYDGPWKVLQEYVLNRPEWKWFRLIDTLAVVQKR